MGQLMADVPSGLNLTHPKKLKKKKILQARFGIDAVTFVSLETMSSHNG
jgi:hypothetical protein